MEPLTEAQKKHWNEKGFLALSGYFPSESVDGIVKFTKSLWDEGTEAAVVVDDLDLGFRSLVSELTKHEKKNRFKVNDLYLCSEEVRALALEAQLSLVLKDLLGEAPVLCNSLSFEFGSQQPHHIDSLYMTPRTPGHLIAIWVALEDCSPDAGPLAYIPGSHKIPLYRFSDGTFHSSSNETQDAWNSYISAEIRVRQLSEEVFCAKKGDVFIWSANLVHGGTLIRNPELTRKSVVFHYYSESDCIAQGCKIRPLNSGFWMDRSPQPVPNRLAQKATGLPRDYEALVGLYRDLEKRSHALYLDYEELRRLGASRKSRGFMAIPPAIKKVKSSIRILRSAFSSGK